MNKNYAFVFALLLLGSMGFAFTDGLTFTAVESADLGNVAGGVPARGFYSNTSCTGSAAPIVGEKLVKVQSDTGNSFQMPLSGGEYVNTVYVRYAHVNGTNGTVNSTMIYYKPANANCYYWVKNRLNGNVITYMPNQTDVAKIIVVEKPAPNNISIVVRERTQNWLVDEFIFEAVGNFASTLSFQAPNGDNTDAIGYKEIGGMNATPYGVQNAPFVSRKNSTFLSLSSNSVEFLMSFFGNGSGNATQTGTLSVSTVPLAAFVYVDGAYAGMTTSVANVTVSNLSVGNHSVLVRREGFQNYETTACIYAGQTTYVIAYLNQSNGTLDVSSSPSGATIWTLNLKTENREVYGGLTPNTISLPAGKYRIRLVKEGYDMPSFMVAINADQVSTLNVVLLKVVSTSAHKKTGTLNIDSTPSGASVYINDVYQGTAPYTVILQGGSYAIKLKKEGHYDYLTAAYMPGIKYIPGGNYTYTGSINAVLTRLGDGER